MEKLPRLFLCFCLQAVTASAAAQTSRVPPPKIKSAIAEIQQASGVRNRSTPIKAVTNVGQGQAGYVHYFLITHSDGELEYQVGIELEDQRIAWSFPEVGVTVSDFIKRGFIHANGKPVQIEHLHGIRPFNNEAQMQVLRLALTRRVAQWVDDATPYCLIQQPGAPFCLSCGDFVVRMLFPGPLPLYPSLPQDFARSSGAHGTNELLLYLTGLYHLPDEHAMLARLSTMDIPKALREDLVAMIKGDDNSLPVQIDSAPSMLASSPAPAAAPSREVQPARAAGRRVAIRRSQQRRL